MSETRFWWEELPELEPDDTGIPPEVRFRVVERDHGQCMSCGTENGVAPHHVLPRSVGGTHTEDNLVLLCWRCHAMVHNGLKKVKWIDGDFYFG